MKNLNLNNPTAKPAITPIQFDFNRPKVLIEWGPDQYAGSRGEDPSIAVYEPPKNLTRYLKNSPLKIPVIIWADVTGQSRFETQVGNDPFGDYSDVIPWYLSDITGENINLENGVLVEIKKQFKISDLYFDVLRLTTFPPSDLFELFIKEIDSFKPKFLAIQILIGPIGVSGGDDYTNNTYSDENLIAQLTFGQYPEKIKDFTKFNRYLYLDNYSGLKYGNENYLEMIQQCHNGLIRFMNEHPEYGVIYRGKIEEKNPVPKISKDIRNWYNKNL